jgi:hypothetical protein
MQKNVSKKLNYTSLFSQLKLNFKVSMNGLWFIFQVFKRLVTSLENQLNFQNSLVKNKHQIDL